MRQQCSGSTLGEKTSTSHSDHIVDLDHVAGTVQFNDEVLVDDYESGLKVPELFSCPPFLAVANTALEGLVGVLLHDLLKSFH